MQSLIKKSTDLSFHAALQETISQITRESLETFFNCKLNVADHSDLDKDSIITACVAFRQGLESVTLRLSFDESFILALISNFYESDFVDENQRALCEDAASELANVISNRVKYFMNSHDFTFFIDMPYIERDSNSRTPDKIIDLNFSMQEALPAINKNSVLTVDL